MSIYEPSRRYRSPYRPGNQTLGLVNHRQARRQRKQQIRSRLRWPRLRGGR
jgi:hypothetical protein